MRAGRERNHQIPRGAKPLQWPEYFEHVILDMTPCPFTGEQVAGNSIASHGQECVPDDAGELAGDEHAKADSCLCLLSLGSPECRRPRIVTVSFAALMNQHLPHP